MLKTFSLNTDQQSNIAYGIEQIVKDRHIETLPSKYYQNLVKKQKHEEFIEECCGPLFWLTIGIGLAPTILAICWYYTILEPLIFFLLLTISGGYLLYYNYRKNHGKCFYQQADIYLQVQNKMKELNLSQRTSEGISCINNDFYDIMTTEDTCLKWCYNFIFVAYYYGKFDQVEQIIQKYSKLPILAQGLTKLEKIASDPEKKAQVEQEYMNQLELLSKDLSQLVKPELISAIPVMINSHYVNYVPKSVQRVFSDNLADQLIKAK